MSASPWSASHCQVVRELPYDFCAASGCVGTTCNVALWTSNVMRPAVILEDHQGFKGFATCDRHVFVAVMKMCCAVYLWLSKMATRVRGATLRLQPALRTTASFDVQRVCMARTRCARCTMEAPCPQSRERTNVCLVAFRPRRKVAKS